MTTNAWFATKRSTTLFTDGLISTAVRFWIVRHEHSRWAIWLKCQPMRECQPTLYCCTLPTRLGLCLSGQTSSTGRQTGNLGSQSISSRVASKTFRKSLTSEKRQSTVKSQPPTSMTSRACLNLTVNVKRLLWRTQCGLTLCWPAKVSL